MTTPYEHLRGQLPKTPKNWLITGVADMAKAQRLPGFAPTHQLAEGLVCWSEEIIGHVKKSWLEAAPMDKLTKLPI